MKYLCLFLVLFGLPVPEAGVRLRPQRLMLLYRLWRTRFILREIIRIFIRSART